MCGSGVLVHIDSGFVRGRYRKQHMCPLSRIPSVEIASHRFPGTADEMSFILSGFVSANTSLRLLSHTRIIHVYILYENPRAQAVGRQCTIGFRQLQDIIAEDQAGLVFRIGRPVALVGT